MRLRYENIKYIPILTQSNKNEAVKYVVKLTQKINRLVLPDYSAKEHIQLHILFMMAVMIKMGLMENSVQEG